MRRYLIDIYGIKRPIDDSKGLDFLSININEIPPFKAEDWKNIVKGSKYETDGAKEMIAKDDIISNTKFGTIIVLAVDGDKALIRNIKSNVVLEVESKILVSAQAEKNTYNIRIQSPFILTTSQVKEKLGIGFKVLSVEQEKMMETVEIVDIDSAVDQIIKVGFRGLARANHPDLGGDANIMVILNRAKKELLQLLESVK